MVHNVVMETQLSGARFKKERTMETTINYKKDGITYAIRKLDCYDKQAPFWVYYNSKLVSKFSTLKTAQDYIKVLMR